MTLDQQDRQFLSQYLQMTMTRLKAPRAFIKKAKRIKNKLDSDNDNFRLSSKDLELLMNVCQSGISLSDQQLKMISRVPWHEKILKYVKYRNTIKGLNRIKSSQQRILEKLKEQREASRERNKGNSRSKKSRVSS